MKKFKKIKEKVFKPIKELDAEIITIENEQDKDKTIYWIVKIGLCESMGERGYIYTLFYDEKPTHTEIINDIGVHIREQVTSLSVKFVLSASEEEQLKVLKKVGELKWEQVRLKM